MSIPVIATSRIATAFDPNPVGIKVVDPGRLLSLLRVAIMGHDFGRGPEGHADLWLPPEACTMVSAGVGPRSSFSDDYFVRGAGPHETLYLKREVAPRVTGLRVVVDLRATYLALEEVREDAAESARIEATDATHVVLRLIDPGAPRVPMSVGELIGMLADERSEAAHWGEETILRRIVETLDFDDQWSVVADPDESWDAEDFDRVWANCLRQRALLRAFVAPEEVGAKYNAQTIRAATARLVMELGAGKT